MANNSQFHELLMALGGAEALVMAPTADSLEDALERVERARTLLTGAVSGESPAAALNMIHRLRALTAQAERFFGAMVSLGTDQDEGTWNYGQNGKPGMAPARAEVVVHG